MTNSARKSPTSGLWLVLIGTVTALVAAFILPQPFSSVAYLAGLVVGAVGYRRVIRHSRAQAARPARPARKTMGR